MQPLKLYAGTCNLDSVSVCSVAMTVLARNQGLDSPDRWLLLFRQHPLQDIIFFNVVMIQPC